MIASEVVPVAKLIKTFRQSGDSKIFENMGYIRKGEPKMIAGPDFKIAVPNQKYSAVDEILMLYKSEYDRLGGNDQLCLLTPFRNKKYGTSSEALNIKLQEMINPKGNTPEIRISNGEVFRVGDPVMQLKNRLEVANGDVGRVVTVAQKYLVVKYIDCYVTYTLDDLETNQLTLAYAMSVHKSQGSEYASVITCMLNEHGPMLQRNLLYTAVTRAKKKLILVCEPEAVQKAVTQESSSKRKTFLVEKLKGYSSVVEQKTKAIA